MRLLLYLLAICIWFIYHGFWDEKSKTFMEASCTSSTVPLVDLSLDYYISYKDIITMHKIEK